MRNSIITGTIGWLFISILFTSTYGAPANERTLILSADSPIYEAQHCKSLDLRDAVTLEAWIKPEKFASGGARIIDKSKSGTSSGYLLDTFPGNSLRMIVADSTLIHDAKLPTDRFSHVVGVFSRKKNIFKLYLDGKEVADHSRKNMKRMLRNQLPLRIGSDSEGQNRFRGIIDRVTIYNRALTAKEIARLAADTSHQSHNLGGRVADWDFRRSGIHRFISTAPGALSLSFPLQLQGQAPPPEGNLVLWYRHPASQWVQAQPVGNGRLGAMVFGGVKKERLQINEDTVWDGYAMDRINPKALEALPKVRKLLFEDKNTEAAKLAAQTMMGVPPRIKSYQSLCDLWLEVSDIQTATNYRRELDLETGIARTIYKIGSIQYRREVFASAPDQVIVIRWTANKPGKISFILSLTRQENYQTHTIGNNQIVLQGQCNPKGISFEALAQVITEGGKVTAQNEALAVKNADTVTILLAGATNYKKWHKIAGDPHDLCRDYLKKAAIHSYQQLKNRHIRDYQRLFKRVELNLGGEEKSRIPTDLRLQALQHGEPDPALIALYFQFGRYLLMSSSRPGSLPANLQGIWNDHMQAPWNSDFHTNINLQMNYWPVEVCNLSECHLPLFDYMDSLVKSGHRTAKLHYGCRGWVVHHLSDVWGFTVPADGVWGIWPMGAAWLCRHPWEHYLFTEDKQFLRRQAWPLMKGAAKFMLDFMVVAPPGTPVAGKLVTNPSHSPENSFRKADGTVSMFTYASTMDLMIIHDLFTNCIKAIDILALDDPAEQHFRAQLESALKRLAPLQISKKDGRLQEWIKDYDEPNPGHRHMSHFYGLHPGDQITLQKTPKLARALRKSLEYRLSHGGGHTGWSRAWIINFWARLLEPEKAYQNLLALLQKSTLSNLFDTHPPFQIDGNFGGTAGIAEMLLQSHTGEVHLLPALPAEWANGSVKGLCARGGFEIDMTWTNGRLTQARIKSRLGNLCKLHYQDKHTELPTTKNTTYLLNGKLEPVK